jgi:hypothetical protein
MSLQTRKNQAFVTKSLAQNALVSLRKARQSMLKFVLKFIPRIGILIVLPMLALSAFMLNAQESTAEPIPSETIEAEASPISTEIPSETPTEAPIVTEESSPLPDTPAPSPETGLAPEPPFSLLVREMLDNGDLSPWNIGGSWSLVASEEGQAFQTNASESLELLKGNFYNVAVQARFLSDTGTAILSLRNSAAGNYSLRLSPNGNVELYRADSLVTSALVSASTFGQWRIMRLSAVDGIVRAFVDNIEVLVYEDTVALPSGTIRISASFADAEAANSLIMDDFFLWVPAAELANYPAPTVYAPVPTLPTEAASATEIAVTPTESQGTKDLSFFPAPSPEELSSASLTSTLGNDNFDGLEINFLPYTVSDETIGDTTEVSEPSSGCGFGISNTVWFKYTPTFNGSFRLSTTGSNFDTILAIYTGASLDTLSQAACNDDISATDLDSQFNVSLNAGTTYYIQLGGFNGRYGTYSLTMQLLGIAAPTVPTLNSLANAARINDTTPDLSWNAALNVYQYEVQVSTVSTFNTTVQTAFVNDPSTSHSLSVLANSAGTLYYWRVRAINGSGVASAFSAVRSFTLDTTAPTPPNLSAPANAAVTINSKPVFSWMAVTGAQAYFIDIDDNNDFSSILQTYQAGTTSFTPPNPIPQGTYYWQLRVQDVAGNMSIPSASRSFTIKILSAPANNAVIFTNTGEAAPVLTWVAVSGVTSYTVQIDNDTDFTNGLVREVPLGNVLTYTVSPALATGVYYWQVLPTGVEQTTAVYNKFTISPPALAAPSLSSPANASKTADTTPNLVWASVAGATQYEVQWATNATFKSNLLSQVVSDPTTSLTLPSLPNAAGQLYYWRVRSLNNFGVAGAFSLTRSFTLDTLAPDIPALLAPADNAISTNSRPVLSWTAETGASAYLIDLADNVGFSNPVLNGVVVTTTSYTLPNSLAQGTYNWRVRAVDSVENLSDQSAIRSFTVNILTAPANNAVIITATGQASPILQWTAVSGATAYTIQIDNDTNFTNGLVREVPLGNVLTYSVSPALPTGIYYWQVVPTGFAQTTAIYRKFTISPAALAAPSLVSPANAARINDTTPNLSWNLVAGAYQYEVQWATNATFTANMQSFAVNDPVNLLTLPTLPDSAGTLWYWRVRTINNLGVAGVYSIARSFTLDNLGPSAPNLLTPTEGAVTTNARPVISWQAVTGANYYEVEYTLPGGLTITQNNTTTSFLVSVESQSQGTIYWRIAAVDAAGNKGSYSPLRSFTVKILSAPANNTVITNATGSASPVLSWVAWPGALSYTVQIDDDANFNNGLVREVPLGNVLTYTVSPALPTGVYYWQVVPTGFAQTTAVYSQFTISPGNLAAPVLVSPAQTAKINDVTPDLSWNPVTNAYHYEVQWSTSATFTTNTSFTVVFEPTTSLTLPTLPNTAGTLYYWRVRTINSVGVAGAYSASRSFTLDTLVPNVPALLAPANGSTTTTNPVTFTWAASTGAFRYELRYGTTNPPTILIANLATTTYLSPSPMLMQSYYWQVRAVDAAGNASDWSSVREVKINSSTSAAPILNRYTTSTPTLFWTPISWTSAGGYYQVQVDNNATFASPEYSNTNVSSASPSVTTTALGAGTWNWRVRACNSANVCGAWSTAGRFVIEQ